MSERCMTLRSLLTSSGPVNVGHLQLALQWQYELLRSSHVNQFHAHSATNGTTKELEDSLLESNLTKCERGKETEHLLGKSPLAEVCKMVSAACKSPSRSSFVFTDFNLKIKMKLSAAHPSDLEKSDTVIITHSPTTQKTDHCTNGTHCNSSPVQPTKTKASGPRSRDWIQHSQRSLDDPGLSPIRNVLSSTITDKRDESTSTTEGIPSLLWDSYDLQDHNQDTVDGHNLWSLWSSEDQFGVMSFSGLTEADVLGLEDDLDPGEYDNLKEARSTGSASETRVSEDDGHCNEASTEAAFHSWLDLLTELRLVYILDKEIMEEHLKTFDIPLH
ncbi:unnamed protein product [Pleuronectes platessa]|uniref:Uncharacterized protein n=1 Tax=Pleuronectes platessa TaxID=8262 RepID=A0A9N7TJX9_PLEPL|nr:unnamed protein product [Pleuronectes platessa]